MGKENIIATREGVLVMEIRKNRLIRITAISFLLTIFWSASAYAQPQVTGFSGSLINGSSITITGSSFGANGPNIVVFDDFESGTNGSNIKIGASSATIGEWTSVTYLTNTPPKYSNAHSLSGSLAFRGDATVSEDGSGSVHTAYKMGFTTSDIFVSYWYYFPTTSDWPCSSGGICNNKLVWVTGSGTTDDDRVIPANSGGSKTTTPNLYMFCNDCIGGESPLSPALYMSKGKWYRFWAYLHGAGNTTDHEELWVASPSSEANLAAATRINRTTQIWNTDFNGFNRVMINGFNRWCNDCAESAPTFDDVYVAIGTGARARVEIGDAATYATSKNLTIATVTSWSDTSITTTIRQGSFSNLNNAYLYVIDADGNVNTNGYLLSDGGGGGGNTPPSSSGGDASASGGSGCGYIKDINGKGPMAKGEGVALMIMLIIALAGIALVKYVSKNKKASVTSMRNKNKYKLFFIFVLLLFILTLMLSSQEAYAQIFLSEDWDTGTPPTDWPCKNLPNAITTATFNGWMGRDFLVDNSPYNGGKLSGLSTAIYHSAPRSYYQHRPANDYWTCDISKSLPQPYPTKIHLRFYVYFTNNWLGFDNPPASSYEMTHFIFTNTALAGVDFRFNLVDHVSDTYPYECNNEQAFSGMYFTIEDGNTGGKSGTAPYDCYNLRNNLNRWQCVEFMADAANDRYSQWIDGDLKVNNASTSISQTDFKRIQISGFSSF